MSEHCPVFSIIIVNWNSLEFLKKCLSSIYFFPPSVPYEIIVLDNASHDGVAAYLAENEPDVIFKQLDKNEGFAAANNRGFALSRGRILLFLNPDTELTANALNELIAAVESDPNAGCIGPRLLNTDKSLQTSCIMPFPSILNLLFDIEVLRCKTWKWKFWGIAPMFLRIPYPQEVQVISGACLCLRREVFEKAGGFNEEYFMYSEDVELCYKVTKAGYKNQYVDSAEIIHHGGGATTGNTSNKFGLVLWKESKYKYFIRIHGHMYATVFRITTAVNALLRVIFGIILFIPLAAKRDRRMYIQKTLFKWAIIFSWAIGNEQWVRKEFLKRKS